MQQNVPIPGVVDVARVDRRNKAWREGVGMAAWLAAQRDAQSS